MSHDSRRKPSRFPTGVACAFLLTGCLYTTHRFNSGRLLEPGHSSVTLGGGVSGTPRYGCGDGITKSSVYQDSTGIKHCSVYDPQAQDSGSQTGGQYVIKDLKAFSTPLLNGSISYRLGIHGPIGPFPGLEMGLHLEAPTNPASGEFDLQLGLPVPAGRPYHHSLSAGWGIGFWADDSYFLEYAASRSWGENDLFVNYRAIYLASQLADLTGSVDVRRFRSKRRLIHQSSLGFKWALPDILVLPDFIAPEVGLTYPLAPTGVDAIPEWVLDDRAWDFSLGMGWHFR